MEHCSLKRNASVKRDKKHYILGGFAAWYPNLDRIAFCAICKERELLARQRFIEAIVLEHKSQ